MTGRPHWLRALAVSTMYLAGCGEASAPRAGSGSSAVPSASTLPGDAVFAEGQVLDVRLTLDPTAFTQLEEHGNLEQYVPSAARLEVAGQSAVELAEVGVRYKGSYSLHHCWDEFGGVRSHDAE